MRAAAAGLAAFLLLLAPGARAQRGAGVITTLAGTTPVGGAPQRGYSGDGGPGTSALLSLANVQNEVAECDPNRAQYEQTSHVAVDAAGNVYFSDTKNHRIRRISPQGIITTVAGTGQAPALSGFCDSTGQIGDGGPATSALLHTPGGLAVLPGGDLVIGDVLNNRIRRFSPGGQISTLLGNGSHAFYAPGNPPLSSPLDWPVALAVAGDGTIHFIETHSQRVGKLGSDGRPATVAGSQTGLPGFGGDGGPATSASTRLNFPTGIAFDAQGNLYIADQKNHRLRKVTPGGTISTIAGNGTAGFAGDGGQAAAASLNQPADVAVDSTGNIFIADMANHRVRMIADDGTISTVAGNGQVGRGPDNVAATSSSLNFPSAVALDAAGNLYIVDWQNYLIRKVTFSGAPRISSGGVVNGASFAAAPVPVAAGSIISIFGINLAPFPASADRVPLPTDLASTSVRINGTLAPLFFVSSGQINAQLPFETASGQATAVVINPSGSSSGETFNVANAAIGLFQYPNTNRAIVQNQDFSLNSADNPAARGTVIVAYLTGQGAVNPGVPTGQAAPLDPLSRSTGRPGASIGTGAGRVAANVAFLGLTPGFVGLAQANIEIPGNAPTGNEVVMFVSVDGQAGNTAMVSIK